MEQHRERILAFVIIIQSKTHWSERAVKNKCCASDIKLLCEFIAVFGFQVGGFYELTEGLKI